MRIGNSCKRPPRSTESMRVGDTSSGGTDMVFPMDNGFRSEFCLGPSLGGSRHFTYWYRTFLLPAPLPPVLKRVVGDYNAEPINLVRSWTVRCAVGTEEIENILRHPQASPSFQGCRVAGPAAIDFLNPARGCFSLDVNKPCRLCNGHDVRCPICFIGRRHVTVTHDVSSSLGCLFPRKPDVSKVSRSVGDVRRPRGFFGRWRKR